MSEEPLFKLNNVTKYFKNKKTLCNVNFEIMPGEILGIIGASGAGKTTLLNVLIGFLRPEQGEVLFRFEHLLSFKNSQVYRDVFKKPMDIKKMIGFAAQRPSFYPNLTVQENLEYFGALFNLPKDALKSNIEALLNLMELKSSRYVLSKNLSGGMQRRLDMACSLIHDPKILILDEPTADLDPLLRSHIRELIKIIQSRGTTVILSSHHLSEIEHLCNRIAILKDGSLIDIDTVESIKQKYIKHKKVHIQTKSKHYDKLLSKIDSKLINSHYVQDNVLYVLSNNPSDLIVKLIEKAEKLDDAILDLRIGDPSLDEIFVSISKNDFSRKKVDVDQDFIKPKSKKKIKKSEEIVDPHKDTLHHNVFHRLKKQSNKKSKSVIDHKNVFVYD
jgi:ABC-2 type transport system ATP-binding protein